MSSRKPLQIRFALTVVLLQAASFTTRAHAPEDSVVSKVGFPRSEASESDESNKRLSGGGPLTLSNVLQTEIAGIDSETQDEKLQLIDQAREYREFRSRRWSRIRKIARIATCENGREPSPFCKWMTLEQPRRRRPASSRHRRLRIDLRRVTVALQAGKHLEKALPPGTNEGDLGRALRKVRDFRRLEPLFQAVTTHSECLAPALTTSLALKAEEKFPDDRYRALAEKLYMRTAECGDGASAAKANYRLGMLHVWAGRYAEAEATLAKVMDMTDGNDYRSRAIYWRHIANRQMGEDSTSRKLKQQLVREYPLSIHGLLAGSEATLSSFPIMKGGDPEIQFRSTSRQDLNDLVRAAEALHAIGAGELAFRILDTVSETATLQGAETAFQLYLAVLMHRSGDTIRKFQLLAGVFREDPEKISQVTLEMLYPLSRFDIIRAFEAKADPYVVISLIRQESAFDARARSPAGAMGLMQLLPGTARGIERVNRRQLFDPRVNVRVGTKFLARLLRRYQGDTELALAAYNIGPLRVDEWQKRYPVSNRLLFLDLIPVRETREYVASIVRNYYWYLRLYNRDSLESRLQMPTRPDPAASQIPDPALPTAPLFNVFGSRS